MYTNTTNAVREIDNYSPPILIPAQESKYFVLKNHHKLISANTASNIVASPYKINAITNRAIEI